MYHTACFPTSHAINNHTKLTLYKILANAQVLTLLNPALNNGKNADSVLSDVLQSKWHHLYKTANCQQIILVATKQTLTKDKINQNDTNYTSLMNTTQK